MLHHCLPNAAACCRLLAHWWRRRSLLFTFHPRLLFPLLHGSSVCWCFCAYFHQMTRLLSSFPSSQEEEGCISDCQTWSLLPPSTSQLCPLLFLLLGYLGTSPEDCQCLPILSRLPLLFLFHPLLLCPQLTCQFQGNAKLPWVPPGLLLFLGTSIKMMFSI